MSSRRMFAPQRTTSHPDVARYLARSQSLNASQKSVSPQRVSEGQEDVEEELDVHCEERERFLVCLSELPDVPIEELERRRDVNVEVLRQSLRESGVVLEELEATREYEQVEDSYVYDMGYISEAEEKEEEDDDKEEGSYVLADSGYFDAEDEARRPSICFADEPRYQLTDQFFTLSEQLKNLESDSSVPTKSLLAGYGAISKLASDFAAQARVYGEVIIREIALPPEKKTIRPLVDAGVLGGEKYIVGNTLFKFAVDVKNVVGGFMGAHKVASHELRCLGILAESNSVGSLRYPLMCLIDFLGCRLLAVSLLPINSSKPVVLGSSDGGRTCVDTDAEAACIMDAIGKELRLASHSIKEHGVCLRTPADLEVNRGTDGRLYALDFSRLMPPTPPSTGRKVAGEIFYHLFRPEFLSTMEREPELCPDAFSNFLSREEGKVHNLRIRSAFAELKGRIVTFAKELDETEPPSTVGDQRYVLKTLVVRLHLAGINCRYLGYLMRKVASEYWRVCILLDLIARRMLLLAKERIRHTLYQGGAESALSDALAAHLNLCFSDTPSSSKFWKDALYPRIISYFGPLPESLPVTGENFRSWVYSCAQRTFRQNVKVRLFCELQRRLVFDCEGLSYTVDRAVSKFDTSFTRDSLSMEPRVVSLPRASFARARALQLAATQCSRAEADALRWQAARSFSMASASFSHVPSMIGLAECLSTTQPSAARMFYKLVLSRQATSGARFSWAVFLDSQFNSQEAEEAYLRALHETLDEKQSSKVITQRLLLYADFLASKSHLLPAAKQVYLALLRYDRSCFEAAYNLASHDAILMDVDERVELLEHALRYCPASSPVNKLAAHKLVSVLRGSGRFDEASCYVGEAQMTGEDLRRSTKLQERDILFFHSTHSTKEMSELRGILGASRYCRVKQVSLSYPESLKRSAHEPIQRVLERKLLFVFQQVRHPCTTEVAFIRVIADSRSIVYCGSEFKAIGAEKFHQEHGGRKAYVGVVLGYSETGSKVETWENEIGGSIVEKQPEGGLVDGWDCIFAPDSLGGEVTLAHCSRSLPELRPVLNFRAIAYARLLIRLQA